MTGDPLSAILTPGTVVALRREIEDRLGVLPTFFCVGSPETTARLWALARAGYLDNPLPSLLKERLFVSLSRLCEVRYCIARHAAFLLGHGRPAGDRTCPTQSVAEVVRLIHRPLHCGEGFEPCVARLETGPRLVLSDLDEWAEHALFACAARVFRDGWAEGAARSALRRALGDEAFDALTVLLGYVRTAHDWARSHPELALEDDVRRLLAAHQDLAACVLDQAEARTPTEADATASLLDAIFEHVPAMIFVKEAEDLSFVRLNRSAEELIGLPRSAMLGRTDFDFFPPEEARFFREKDWETLTTGVVVDIPEEPLQTAHGPKWLHTRKVTVRDASGCPTYLLGISLDVTERKKVEQELAQARLLLEERVEERTAELRGEIEDRKRVEAALRASEERFRQAADAVGGIIYSLETASGAVERSRGLLEVLGYDPRDVPATRAWWLRQVHPADLERVEQAYADLSRWPDGRLRIEYRVRHRDGRWLVLEERALALANEDGPTTQVIGCRVDVSDRVRAAEAVRASERALKDADRRKDEFLATLAHELRNPLAPIRNSLRILQRANGDWALVERAQAIMERQVGHMTVLIDDLLDVSRITRGKVELHRGLLELAVVVGHGVEAGRPVVEEYGHELTVTLPPEPLVLEGDLTRLAQVVGNLLTNSARYTPRGGRIRLDAERQGGEVVITVADNGIGIPADALEAVFEPFSQVDRTLERSTGGLGIGLALVRGLVELHGGTVTAASAGLNQGSRFTVRLPLTEAAVPAPDEPHTPPPGPRQRILVVDDNVDGAQALAALVELGGHEVRTVYDGVAAVAAANEFRPDLILMDVGMPRLNGLDATRRIRQQPWGRSMCIVALTGWGQDSDRERSAEAGCDAHLVKPVDPRALEELLARVECPAEPA